MTKSNKKTKSHSAKKLVKKTSKKSWRDKLRRNTANLSERRRNFLARRPHRSFKLTKRRDYRRELKIPGYFAFAGSVIGLIWKHKKTYLILALIFSAVVMLLSSAMSQETYKQLKDAMNEAEQSGFSGFLTTLGLFSGVVMSYLIDSSSPDSSQLAPGLLIGLFTWLSAVWLTRAIVAGKHPRVRDGIYNAGSPVVALMILTVVAVIQMVPAAIAVLIYGALDASGMLDQTIILMSAAAAAVLIATLSAYWLTSTLLAMVIITLPGVYPFRALRLAGDIATGRRVRLLLWLFWALVLLAIFWLIILLPTIMLDSALKSAIPDISWLPIVPFVGLFLSQMSIIWLATYTYLLYRKVVESDSGSSKN